MYFGPQVPDSCRHQRAGYRFPKLVGAGAPVPRHLTTDHAVATSVSRDTGTAGAGVAADDEDEESNVRAGRVSRHSTVKYVARRCRVSLPGPPRSPSPPASNGTDRN